MLSQERRNEIRRILQQEKTVTVDALARRFFVSPSTVRRDLDRIADDGSIRRTYGGAFLLETLSSEPPVALREHDNADAKQSIAAAAASLIHDGATILLDTSSTVTAMVPHLNAFDGLTVITNGIKTAYLLNAYGKITTYCTGGRLREHNMSLVGMTTCQRLGDINADFAFLSCRGLTPEKGITESSEEEAQVKKAMIAAAEHTVLLCDSSKIGMVLMNRVCMPDRLWAIVTDHPLPPEYEAAFRASDIKILITEP